MVETTLLKKLSQLSINISFLVTTVLFLHGNKVDKQPKLSKKTCNAICWRVATLLVKSLIGEPRCDFTVSSMVSIISRGTPGSGRDQRAKTRQRRRRRPFPAPPSRGSAWADRRPRRRPADSTPVSAASASKTPPSSPLAGVRRRADAGAASRRPQGHSTLHLPTIKRQVVTQHVSRKAKALGREPFRWPMFTADEIRGKAAVALAG